MGTLSQSQLGEAHARFCCTVPWEWWSADNLPLLGWDAARDASHVNLTSRPVDFKSKGRGVVLSTKRDLLWIKLLGFRVDIS